MSDLGEGAKIPDLWRMSALLAICPKDDGADVVQVGRLRRELPERQGEGDIVHVEQGRTVARSEENGRACCWVQYGIEGRDSLPTWISENCDGFREMQIVRHAKNVGTMIGPDGLAQMDTFIVGHNHEKIIQRVLKINASTKSRLSD